jgi:hypothetical protein
MSRNGSGTYTLPAGNPVVTGTTISTTWANNTLNDIAATLTDSVAADGQTPMTGDLDLNSNKIVNLTAGTIAGEAVEYSQLLSATSTAAITGGTINNATIGATTPASGRFTTLEVTSTSTFTGNGSFNGTGALKVPVGTTAEQPTPVTGQIRYNTTNNQYEGYGASAWSALGTGAAGSNTQIQYNNSGALAGSANLTYNGTTLATTAVSLSNSAGITFSDASTQSSSVSAIGLGGTAQSWVGVTRSGNVTYTNSTGRPIMVSVIIQLANSTMGLNVGGIAIQALGETGNAPGYLCAIVPNGVTYSVSTPSSIDTWTELR